VFKANVRAWIGGMFSEVWLHVAGKPLVSLFTALSLSSFAVGSLAGTLKTSGPEVVKERWNGAVPDWSTGMSSVSSTTTDVQH
jgi:hypothetical protein